MPEFRLLRTGEVDAAARQHRIAGALIPGYDPTARSLQETGSAYQQVFEHGAVWGAFDGDTLLGHIALEPGWIEHLYVDPSRNGEGIGQALIELAQAGQDDLQLFTYQSNQRARHLYERLGFVVEAFGVDSGHPQRAPNVRYRWRRAVA